MRNISEYTPDMCNQAKKIYEMSEYMMVPKRFVYPERFPHENNSLDAKKALVLGLTPMLTEAEAERKIETAKSEDFTRCKVGRGRGKSSSYEYFDMDTKMRVSVEEYSRR
jgi:hypothetical protein